MTLVADLRLKQGHLHGETTIELCGAAPYKFAQLRELGLINEQVSYQQRFFIPSDEAKGIEVLSKLLQIYPVIAAEETPEDEPRTSAAISVADNANLIDLEEWIIPVVGPAHDEKREASPMLAAEQPMAPPNGEMQPSANAVTVDERESSGRGRITLDDLRRLEEQKQKRRSSSESSPDHSSQLSLWEAR